MEKAIASARDNVIVFCPYLDSALTKLLESVNPAARLVKDSHSNSEIGGSISPEPKAVESNQG